MAADFLAFDLGAESGRALLGRFDAGLLELKDIARFPNGPVSVPGSLRWDILRLWSEIRRTLDHPPVAKLASVGFDAWGVDYALIGENGQLLENPYHYRDRRTEGMVEEVCRIAGREKIYAQTGIQFMPINTLYQLYAASRRSPRLLDAANAIVTIPDLFNYWLTGNLGAEYTNATTTQFMNPRTRSWATGLFDDLGLPKRILPKIFEPGTIIGDTAGTPVVAPACHDTGSAVAAIETRRKAAFLSSGTWSLLGTEVDEPVMTSRALELNFTNEGGVSGTTRLLKNIGGLWLLQSCRRCWQDEGQEYSYEDLLEAAASDRSEIGTLIDPDDPSLLNPPHMVQAISACCRKTGQQAPQTPGAYTRIILESLAFKYRVVLESLEELIGYRLEEIRIIGGGSKNSLLNQFTANATGRTVVAGPVEATALGNIAVQMMATGAVSSLAEARAVINCSFPTTRFEPREDWSRRYPAFGMMAAD